MHFFLGALRVKTKHYVVMTRSATKLSTAILAPVSGQSAVSGETATPKCLIIIFFLHYDQDGGVKGNKAMSQISL